MMMWYSGPNTFAMGLWFLLMWGIWFALLGATVWLVVRFIRPVAPSPVTPLEVLRQRYARGEIDRQTFDEMRQALITEQDR